MNAVFYLEKQFSSKLSKALFEESASKQFKVKKIVYKEKYNLILEIANSSKFLKWTNGFFERFVKINDSFVSEVIEEAAKFDTVYILIDSSSIQGVSVGSRELQTIKKNCPNVKLILYYIDIISSQYSQKATIFRKRYPKLFDLIYTSDLSDAEAYGLRYYPLTYVKNEKYSGTPVNKALFFCANTKNRSLKIVDILNRCAENGIDVSMEILPTTDAEEHFFQDMKIM